MKFDKILFVLNSNGVGGAEVSVKRMVEYHFSNSHVVTMWDHPNYQPGFWDSLKPNYSHLLHENLSLVTFGKSLLKLRKFINESDYKVVQTQLKGADLILGIFMMLGLLNKEVKLVSCIHNSYSYYYEGGVLNKLVGKVHRFLISNFFEKVIVISRQDLDLFAKSFSHKLEVIENAIQIPQKVKNTQYSFTGEKTMTIAMIGNIKERKGYDRLEYLVLSLEKEKVPILVNIAGGVEEQELLSALLNLENRTVYVKVKYVGKINGIFDFLISSDLLLSLSRVEGLPISILEAMSVNLPLVLSDIPGHRLIIPNENQERILFDDLEQAKLLILKKFQNSNLLDEELERQAFLVKNRFDFDAMCAKYEETYQTVLNN